MSEGERNTSVSNFVDRMSEVLNSKDNYPTKKDDDWRYENLYGNEKWQNNKESFKLIEEEAVIPKVLEPVKEPIILPKEIVAPVVAPVDAFQLILQKWKVCLQSKKRVREHCWIRIRIC
jgi:hypothetical protein